MNVLNNTALRHIFIVSLTALLGNGAVQATEPEHHTDKRWQPVSGNAVHYFPTSIVHASVDTTLGKTEYSTDTIDLSGDLKGRLVYHVTSDFDFSAATLTNTGHQVFSGTVLDSAPVMLLDDNFMFTVNLNNGDTRGSVFLTRRLAGPRIQCRLSVTGTGFDAQGNGLAEYTGMCRQFTPVRR
ncbi:hypothetical protein [Alteromonas halophila]|uniref:Uncharacterized protein n=1 Tax=Alteromonas halophila TaxID=516698 RepID=A0A918MUB6_9ALTE|nr:hypothetical protein [Alteromonas halophila]GGW75813.1 hypothetical protein GCM10007391_05250 [Alteromonas halophila]